MDNTVSVDQGPLTLFTPGHVRADYDVIKLCDQTYRLGLYLGFDHQSTYMLVNVVLE